MKKIHDRDSQREVDAMTIGKIVGRSLCALFFVMAGLVCRPNAVMAQEVTVVGMGSDKESALRDATRRAVEQVVGTFIDSQTLMEDLVIKLDEVYKKSQGFVKKIVVLEEGLIDGSTYRLRAKIDVDTDSDAKLMDSLTMIMRLNDPRIVVAVLEKDSSGQIIHNENAESALNSKLLEAGFSHVLDTAQVTDLRNAQLLRNIYEGRRGSFHGKADHAADYLVIGSFTRDANNVFIPRYKESGMLKTSMMNVKATLKVDVIQYNTGDIVGTFVTEGIGIENNKARAGDKAVVVAADRAAEKLAETFKKHGAKAVQGIEFTIAAGSEAKLEKVLQELRSLGAVDNVYIREQSGNKVILSVESYQKPHEIVRQLRSVSSCSIAIESITADSCQLRIT